MSRDAVVPEEWVDAALRAKYGQIPEQRPLEPGVWATRRCNMRRVLEAVVPLAEQRATRSLLKAREETEGR